MVERRGGEFGPFLSAWWTDGPSRRRRTARDWIVDSVLCLAGLILTGLTVLAAVVADTATVWTPVDLAAGVLAAVALWSRRRWPVGLALGLLPLAAVSPAAAVSAAIAVFSVATHRPLRIALALSAAAVVAAIVGSALRPGTLAPLPLLVVSVLIGAALTAWGQFLRARRLLVLSLRDRADRAEADQRNRVGQARRDERTRIAREMHDVLAHRMSLLSMHAGALAYRGHLPPDELARTAEVIRGSAHQALVDLRQVIGVLRDDSEPNPAVPQPTLTDIPALIEEARSAGNPIDTTPDLDTLRAPATADPSVGRDAYRVLQEVLTNARKHAPGQTVRLRVRIDGEALLIETSNRVTTHPTTIPGSGVGLIGLAERIRLAGGELSHGLVGDGFTLRARLPWRS